ncbi:Transcription factor mbp1, partial [Dipsacomyces acuminosporus]
MASDFSEASANQVWSASYAGVEVFQQIYNGTAVMRRRRDSYVNVTQILKCAQFDKSHRTRFLEREIHTGIHEKVQGGYGKYQGTWVPLERAIALARQLSVYDALRHVLEYSPAPGEKPPTAPRSLESMHKPKQPRSASSASGSRTKRRRVAGSPLSHQSSGALHAILNAAGKENIPVPPRPLPAGRYPGGSPGTSASSPQYRQAQPSGINRTPTGGSFVSWNAHPYLTPESNSGGGRHSSAPATGMATPSTGGSSHPGQNNSSYRVADAGSSGYRQSDRALRNITNSYQNGSPDGIQAAPHAQHKQQIKKPAATLLTPPSSTSRRTASAGGHILLLDSNNSPALSQVASPSDSLGHPRPPLRGHPGGNSAGRSQLAHPWNGSPLSNEIAAPKLGITSVPSASGPSYSDYTTVPVRHDRSYSGSVVSAASAGTANHSRSTSCTSQPYDAAASMPSSAIYSANVAKLAEFLSCPRTHKALPAYIEHIVASSASSFDPSAPLSFDGSTALHLAASNAHWDVVQMLVDRGADTTRANREGKTAMMLVVQRSHAWIQRGSHIFEWLLDIFGPSLIKRDKEGRTVIHCACIRPADSPASWAEISLFYLRLLVLKFSESKQLEVFSWNDYLGLSARQLATQARMSSAIVTLLGSVSQSAVDPGMISAVRTAVYGNSNDGEASEASRQLQKDACGVWGSSASSIAQTSPGASNASSHAPPHGLQQHQQQQRRQKKQLSSYDLAASKAVDIIRSATAEMRNQHESQLQQVDEETEYAAQLLLELRTERDDLQQESHNLRLVSQICSETLDLEGVLQNKVKNVINLQQSARASVILQHTSGSPLTAGSSPNPENGTDTAELRAEYLRLQREVEAYHENSLKLADEYSGLAAVVKPWPRPPALSLVGMFDEEDVASDNSSASGHGKGHVPFSSNKPRAVREIAVIDSESADLQAINAALDMDEQRLRKFENVVSAACGDLPLDRVRDVVGPVLS